jgi:drug/metabolite transporter (DMT)-like permease
MPVFALITAVVIWGGSFIATKAAVAEVPPVAFAVMRFGVAIAGLVVAHLVSRSPLRVPRELWGRVALAGFLGITVTYVLENIALRFTTAGNSALFIAASPLLTVMGAVVFLGERLTWRVGTGALLAFTCMVALIGGTVAQTGLGDALMALNTLVGACYALVSKTLADRISPLSALTSTFTVGTLALLPCAGIEALLHPAAWHMSGAAWGSLIYLGIGSSCLAYWLWMYALGQMSASSVGIFLYLMPVVTLFLSAFLLREPFSAAKVAEAALILLGVYLAGSKSVELNPEPV